MQTGLPAKPAANVAQAGAGLRCRLLAARAGRSRLLGTLAWLWLVRWRTGRHRHALWKSLVLPAGGVALCWLLLMTLWLPLLDYARSYRPLVDAHRAARAAPMPASPRRACRAASVAALEYFGRWRVDARHAGRPQPRCDYLLRIERRGQPRPRAGRLALVARERRPTDRDEITAGLPPQRCQR